MNTLKKDLMQSLMHMHLFNEKNYLEDLYESIANDEDIDDSSTDKEIIAFIKKSMYNDILIIKCANMKEYNQKLKELALECWQYLRKNINKQVQNALTLNISKITHFS